MLTIGVKMMFNKDGFKNRVEEQLRRGSAAATHQIALRVGDDLPMWIGCGYPKSGTVWLCKMMAGYLGVPYPQNYLLPVAMKSVIHAHWEYDARLPPTMYIARDGRDVLTSLYFYNMRKLKSDRNPAHAADLKARYTARFGAGFDPDDIVKNLPGFIEIEMRTPTSVKTTWQQHVLHWLDKPGVTLVRYEDLVDDCAATLGKAMGQMTGEEPDFELAALTADRYAFSRTSKRQPGVEDRSSFQRKGIAGDWKNHFTQEAAEAYDAHCGEALRRLGYVDGNGWVQESDLRHTSR